MNARRVRRARRIIAKDRCPRLGIMHRWVFDGYFWHTCVNCGRVS